MSTEGKPDPIKYFISGGFGGICTVLTGHPLDTLKVRLQTMPSVQPGQTPMYTGAWDCAVKTVKREGFLGLYKGMGAPITGVAPIFAISFLGFGLGKKIFASNSETLTPPQLFCAGSFSGIFTAIIMVPGERIKCILQIQESGNQKYKGPISVIKKLYSEGGVKSLYKGTCATLLRDIPACGVYFMTYELLVNYQKEKSGNNINMLNTIFAGGMAGILNWLVAMPPDVLKSRLQTAPENMYPRGVRDVFLRLYREEGLRALYSGVTPVMLRAFPANAACFLGVEFGLKTLNILFPTKSEKTENL
ncbi:congested-like trachea protein isoform X1 [Daktulosphaira vitifoliae]|uniref:congested-like trachea protein isoform X1 n=1 Tax=Daktulosphaira vitifoliae TaxID=58002 RepID=UPI0021AA92C8|nr:congested-like trachea protein isoform X1 [Daktulosphaira vitifoliae]